MSFITPPTSKPFFSLVEELFEATGFTELVPLPALQQGLELLQGEFLRLALEVHVAVARGQSLREAALDFEQCPLFFKVHAAAKAYLTLGLDDPALRRWTNRLLRSPEPAVLEDLRTLLVGYAALHDNPVVRTGFRVLLFEAVCMELHLSKLLKITRRDIPDEAIDEAAEVTVARWLTEDPLPPQIRPIEVIVEAALRELPRHAPRLLDDLAYIQHEVAETRECELVFDELAATMDARSAILLRNSEHVAPVLREQQLSLAELQRRHVVLQGVEVNSLNQRLLRTISALKTDGPSAVKRDRPAICDLIAAMSDSQASKGARK